VPDDRDNDGKAARPRRQPQLPLPYGEPSQHQEFIDIIAALERGEITPARAEARVMAFYQLGLGAWVRALGETFPELAASLLERLQRDHKRTAEHLADSAATVAPTRAPARPPRIRNKSTEVLQRERKVLAALLASNAPFAFGDLLALSRADEADLKDGTLTANLDRLVREQCIERPSKGYYRGSPATRGYLQAVESELESRGHEAG
jgi:hypothetical protein